MNHSHAIMSLVVVAAWISGCGQTTEEIATGDQAALQEALELENGGFTTEDGEPLFGMDEEFADVGLDVEEPAVEDPMLIHGPEARPYEGDEGGAITVVAMWGLLRVDPDNERPRRWDGEISTTIGALVARRTIRFEGPTDALLPRPDPQTIPFMSTTMPHNDGLVISLVPPTADAPEPALLPELVVRLNGLEEIRIAVADLADGFRMALRVDDLGNTVVITTVPAHPCPHGVLAGVWRSVRPGRLGTFHGRWEGSMGELQGHLRGIYGVNRAGQRVFFGKYIGVDGAFRGILRGVYGDGRFTGHWVNRGGELTGGLAGHYVEAEERVAGDGLFVGGWVEACGADECLADGDCPGLDLSVDGAEDLPL